MLKFLRQPYIAPESKSNSVWVALVTGLFVSIFLAIFQPFGSYEWHSSIKIPFLMGFGGVTSVVMLFNSSVLPRLFPTWYAEPSWTIGKEIIHIVWTLLTIATGNYFYGGLWFGLDNGSLFFNFLSVLLVTLIIGIFPIVGITLLGYFNRLKKYQYPPQPQQLSKEEIKADSLQVIIFVAENEKDKFSVSAASLLYLESADNYSEIVFVADGTIQKELIRGSLSRLESQIPVDYVVRCHRSYIVNLHQVKSVSGNAQGYKFHLNQGDMAIPVARKYSDIVVKQFRN